MDIRVLEAQVEILAEKCENYSKSNGKENPDFLIEYGKALFALAKQKSSLVDSQKIDERQLPMENPNVKVSALEDQFDEESEEEEEEEAAGRKDDKQSGELAEIDSTNNNNTNTADSQEGSKEQEDHDEKKEQQKEDGNQESMGDKEVVEEGEGEDEDENDYAAAFEIVDVARVLYEKESDKSTEILSKLAKTRELLGDIALEDDNPQQAIEDYTAAVEIKRKLHGTNSGEVSEAEFMLSLAYDVAGDAKLSLEHLKVAAEAATTANLPSASELQSKAKDMEQDINASAKLAGHDVEQAKQTTKESISGRSAIATAIKSLVSDANDISQLTRKRKRPEKEQTEPVKSKQPAKE